MAGVHLISVSLTLVSKEPEREKALEAGSPNPFLGAESGK